MEEIIKILEEIKNEELDPKGKETVHVNNSITSKFRRLNNKLEKIKGYESIEKVKKQILDLNNENSLINVLSKQKGTLKQKHAESLISQIETLISKCKEDIEKNNTKVEGIYNDYSLNGGEVKMDLNEQIENLRKEALELLDSIEVISKEQKEEYRKTILDAKDIDNLNICMTTLKGIEEVEEEITKAKESVKNALKIVKKPEFNMSDTSDQIIMKYIEYLRKVEKARGFTDDQIIGKYIGGCCHQLAAQIGAVLKIMDRQFEISHFNMETVNRTGKKGVHYLIELYDETNDGLYPTKINRRYYDINGKLMHKDRHDFEENFLIKNPKYLMLRNQMPDYEVRDVYDNFDVPKMLYDYIEADLIKIKSASRNEDKNDNVQLIPGTNNKIPLKSPIHTNDFDVTDEEIKEYLDIYEKYEKLTSSNFKSEKEYKQYLSEILKNRKTETEDNTLVEEVIEENTEEKVETIAEAVEVKKYILFDYYDKTEVENIQKELMNNITDLKYSFIEQQKKTEQKKEKLEELFNPMSQLDPEWAKTNKMLEDERFRLNRINNLLNSDNFKELLNIENAINSIKIEHNKETKRYHVVSNINPYELAQKTSNVLIKLQDDINTQDLGDNTFTNSVKEKMQTINNNMKRLYAKFGYTDLYFDIKTKYDKINYLKNQINHWKELEKIQGKSYEKEINEALYEIEVIKNTIKSLIDNLPEEEKDKITNIDEIKDIIEDIEDKKEKTEEVTETPEEEPKEDIYNDRDAIIETIKGIVSTISLDEPEEKLNKKLDEIEKYLIKLNKLDQKEFEEKYNNAKTVEEKQQLIIDRENQVESYRELLKHKDKEVEKLLSDRFNPLIDGFKNDIVKDKEKTEDKPQEIPEGTKEEIPKKGRLKVMAKKALKWMKEHKLAIIAIGLALTTAIMFAIPSTHMMINSALWNVGSKLGWSAGTLGKLHSINLGLSKSVAGGAYIFESMSGAYTLGGAAGASALYGSGAANLVGALTGLTGLGAIGTFGASIINKIKNRKKKKEDEPKEVFEEEIKEEKEEIVEETKSKEKELEKENEKSTTVENDKEETKSTPLTKEQIAEMIKAEVEKAVAQKNAEISKLSAENEMLKAEIEMLKKQGLQPEEIEEENIMKL